MSAKMVESSKAVIIYLAISISHLPNGLFHAAKIHHSFLSPKHWGTFFGGKEQGRSMVAPPLWRNTTCWQYAVSSAC